MEFSVWGAVLGAGALFAMAATRAVDQASETGRKGESPAEEAARIQLRTAHQVEPVPPDWEGSDVNLLPCGVYGFTYTPGMEVAPLFRKRAYQSFEVHKDRHGMVWIAGFLPEAHARAFEEGAAVLDLQLYPEPFQDATSIVAIPRSRVIRAKERPSREEGNPQPITVGPREG